MMTGDNQATTSECNDDEDKQAPSSTVLKTMRSASGPILMFYDEDEETTQQIPGASVQRSALLRSVVDAVQTEGSQFTVPFPSDGLVTWIKLCSQPSGFVHPQNAVHALEVAIYFGDEDTARIASKHVAEFARMFVRNKRNVEGPQYMSWRDGHPFVQVLCDLSIDALDLVVSHFKVHEMVSAPDTLSHAWVQNQLRRNSGQLTLNDSDPEDPLQRMHESEGCVFADEYIAMIGTFWNAPDAAAHCSDLFVPAFSYDAASIAHCMGRRLPKHFVKCPEYHELRLSKPVSSILLQPLAAVTALTLGSPRKSQSPHTDASLVCQLLELLPNLKSLTMHASIETEDSMQRKHEHRALIGSSTDTKLIVHEEITQFAAQVFKLPLQELFLSDGCFTSGPCTALCPHLQQATELIKLRLPRVRPAERAAYLQATSCLRSLQFLACGWPATRNERPSEALGHCLQSLQPLTALHTLDLTMHLGSAMRSLSSNAELDVLAEHLSLRQFPNLKHFRFEAELEPIAQNPALNERTIRWLKSLQSLHSLSMHVPVDSGGAWRSLYDFEEDFECSKRHMDSSLLLPLLPVLDDVQVVTHFQARLRDYVDTRFRDSWGDLGQLHRALSSVFTELKSLRVMAAQEDCEEGNRYYEDMSDYLAFLGGLSICIRALSNLRDVSIVCSVQEGRSSGMAAFMVQLIAMTQLESLVFDVSEMNGNYGCILEICAIEAAAAQVQESSEEHQLTRLRFKCQEPWQASPQCSDSAAALLQRFTKLADLSICFGFSLSQYSFLGSLTKLEHLRFPVVGNTTKEEWSPLVATLGELACLQSLTVDGPPMFEFTTGDILREGLSHLRQLSSLKFD